MNQNEKLFQRASHVIPGGVNSPVRAFRGVGGTPLFVRSGKGAMFTDENGKTYLDFVGSWGPLILGHAPDVVVRALREALTHGTTFGAPTEGEILLAEKICAWMPAIEMLRLVNSGTEATMSALRLARGYTGREKIIKFQGCYHGHVDSLLVAAGSGALTNGVPDSQGVTAGAAKDTLVSIYNDLDHVEHIFKNQGKEIAAVIVEPVAGNMGCVLPEPGFLSGLRRLTEKHGALLIFDEVMTGFRLAKGGAQERFSIHPDLTCLGKIMGGGLPVGAYGGAKKIMAHVAPEGGVYQAGTLSGNPLAVAAGLATLTALESPGVYEELEKKAATFAEALQAICQKNPGRLTFNHIATMFCLYFHPGPVNRYAQVMQSDVKAYAKFFHALLDQGIYFAPSAFESGFISLAHSERDLQRAAQAIGQAVLT